MSGEPSNKRKREDGDGSSEDDDEQHLPPEKQWDTDHTVKGVAILPPPNKPIVEGVAILPPPNKPIVEGTCWAQACVMSIEANYRAMYAHKNRSFPTLSIKHCIDSLIKPGQPYAELEDVCHWLKIEGVATEIEYNAVGPQAKTKYKDTSGMPIVLNLRCGILVGGYDPENTTTVGEFTYVKQVTTSNENERSIKDKSEPGHLVMLIGYKRIGDIYYLIFYSGYESVEFIDLECIFCGVLAFGA